MQKILNVYKPKGLTPLQTIQLVRKKFPEYENTKIGFAGRLDPLAHGVLLLMVGEETTKERDTYLNLPKEYEFEAVFGVSTDTYDTLGIIQNSHVIARKNDEAISRLPRSLTVARNDIQQFIQSKQGKQIQTYPPYSSKTVLGKPLYLWARENKLSKIQIPKREIEIYNFTLREINMLSVENLKTKIMNQVTSVDGDFRQKTIKEKWETFFTEIKMQTLPTALFHINCSSGTYIRSLIHELGKQTGMEAIALEILRTKVGEHNLSDSLKLT